MEKISFQSLVKQILKHRKQPGSAVLYCRQFSQENPVTLQIESGIKFCRANRLNLVKTFIENGAENKAFRDCYNFIGGKRVMNFVSFFSGEKTPKEGIILLDRLMKKYKINYTIR